MSMNEQSFYTGAARGSVVTDPEDLPRFVISTGARLKPYGGALLDSFSASFWTVLDYNGAIANVSVANTWTDIVDITGAGFLGNVIASNGIFTGSKTIGFRLTVDGELWEWTETIVTTTPGGTLMMGAISPRSLSIDATFPGTATRLTEKADAVGDDTAVIVPASVLLSLGAPVLAFRQSLKVQVKNNRVGSSSQGQRAGCTFVLR